MLARGLFGNQTNYGTTGKSQVKYNDVEAQQEIAAKLEGIKQHQTRLDALEDSINARICNFESELYCTCPGTLNEFCFDDGDPKRCCIGFAVSVLAGAITGAIATIWQVPLATCAVMSAIPPFADIIYAAGLPAAGGCIEAVTKVYRAARRCVLWQMNKDEMGMRREEIEKLTSGVRSLQGIRM
jgi:hypothetical protein